MNKYSHAVRHSIPSVIGILRTFFQRPAFGVRLFQKRLRYFLSRELVEPLITPEGFSIDTPDALIAYWSMFVERELYDARWVEPIRNATRPLIVDVGANAGVFSLFAHCLNPTAEIIAFEPLPVMQVRLAALQKQTGINLTIHGKAVSKSVGEALFESPHGYDGISRFASVGQSGANTFRVETTTLDSVLSNRKIALMKVDVEGFECDVIEGGRRCLAQTDFLIMEAQDPEHLANITRALGDGWMRKKLGAGDYLFVRERR